MPRRETSAAFSLAGFVMPQAPVQHRLTQGRSAKVHRNKARERRGTARQRGYTKQWEKFRQQFLAEHPLCEYCLAKGKTVAAKVVDHDIPHGGDPDLFWNNTFTALCVPCHSGPKQRLEAVLCGDALKKAITALKSPKSPG